MMRTTVVSVLVAVVATALVCAVVCPPAAAAEYGPCCPLVQGQKALTAHTSAAGTRVMGPRYTCRTRPMSLTYAGDTHAINAVRAAGSMMVPARIFTLMGANVEWAGDRHVTMTLGARKADVTLGSYAVQVTDGSDATTASLPLCPRLIHGITYVPMRPLAETLGLAVAYEPGTVSVTAAEPVVATAMAEVDCPASSVEKTLGVKLVRSPADSDFGVGVGVEDIQAGGTAEGLGIRSKDVILSWNGSRVKCPRDLEQLVATADGTSGQMVTVARASRKVMLHAK